MSERAFVDTNVLVYADDSADLAKRDRARELIRRLIRERRPAEDALVALFAEAAAGFVVWSAEAIASAFVFGSLSAETREFESGGDCLRTPNRYEPRPGRISSSSLANR